MTPLYNNNKHFPPQFCALVNSCHNHPQFGTFTDVYTEGPSMKSKFDFTHYFSRNSRPQKQPKNPEISVLHQFCALANSYCNHPQFGIFTDLYTEDP